MASDNCSKRCRCDSEEEKEECRFQIDSPEDDNCCLVSVCENGSHTLKEIGERMDLTPAGVKSVEDRALGKLKSKFRKIFDIDLLKS